LKLKSDNSVLIRIKVKVKIKVDNKKNKAPYILGISVIAIAVIIVLAQNSKSSNVTYNNTSAPLEQLAPNTSTTDKTYTMTDVTAHSSQTSCWTAINGNVYDVTSWIKKHPGGAGSIISLCGIDGSSAYNGQHGGQRRPANELAGFKIGVLK
jgi:cytochrome b involved in lipid metabolism